MLIPSISSSQHKWEIVSRKILTHRHIRTRRMNCNIIILFEKTGNLEYKPKWKYIMSTYISKTAKIFDLKRKQLNDKFNINLLEILIMVPHSVKATSRYWFSILLASQPWYDYPLGIQYRFFPNTLDTDFAILKTARRISQ